MHHSFMQRLAALSKEKGGNMSSFVIPTSSLESFVSSPARTLEKIRTKEQSNLIIYIHLKGTRSSTRASLIAQLVKKQPAMQETPVQSLGWGDLLQKGKATHSSILAWRIPWTIQSMELQRVGHNWATLTFTFTNSTQEKATKQIRL